MTHGQQRAGFTLIELLVVIALIAVLAALGVGVSFSVIESQRQGNTEAGMRAAHKTLEQHWSFVIAQAKKESPSATAMLLARDSTGVVDPQRAQVIWIKFRLMEAFPISFKEINDPAPANPKVNPKGTPLMYQVPTWGSEPYIPARKGEPRRWIASYQSMLQGRTGAGGPNPAETSACLFMSLSLSRDGVKLEADTLKGTNCFNDSDNDGLNEITDAWRRPLMFFRFPTDQIGAGGELQALAPSGGSADPVDPVGKLLNPTWHTPATGPRPVFESLVHPVSLPRSAYIVPALVSGGRDGKMGLDPFTMAAISADAGDNIYSFRLKLGARGD
jgi:prepilin-type N-terminal cleavage/methylation domain-containing protein